MIKIRFNVPPISPLFLYLSVFSLFVLFFQNCSSQKNLELLVSPGSGVSVQLSSTLATDLDENVETIPVKIIFGTKVENFDESKLQVSNATIMNLNGDGQIYDLNLRPNGGGIIQVSVPRNSCKKIKSNTPCGESNLLEFRMGNYPPTVTLKTYNNVTSVSDTFQIEAVFSKEYFLKDLNNFIVTNATLENATLKEDSTCLCEYYITVKPNPIQPGETIKVQAKENILFNKWAVGNSASNELSVLFDVFPPQVILASSAPDQVYETFNVTLISSIPVPPNLVLTADSFNIVGADLIAVTEVLNTQNEKNSFRLNLSVRPTSDLISIQLKNNVLKNKWELGNPLSNTITRTYLSGQFQITYPQPLIALNPANVHNYNIEGICPYMGIDVKLFINNPNRTLVKTMPCQLNTQEGKNKFTMNSVDFGNLAIGAYIITLETADNSGYPVTRNYPITMSTSLNASLDVTPNTILFDEAIAYEPNQRLYSNPVYIYGLDANATISASFGTTTGDPKFRVIRNDNPAGLETSSVGQLKNGDMIQVSVVPSPVHATVSQLTVNIGNISTQWTVKYIDKNSSAIIFVTSSQFSGTHLISAANADNVCKNIADAAGFSNTHWRAIISGPNITLKDRLPWAWHRLKRYDGAVVATNLKQLMGENLNASISLNEFGKDQNSSRVMTGFKDNTGASGISSSFCGTDNNNAWNTSSLVSMGNANITTAKSWFFNEGNVGLYCTDYYPTRAPIYCISNTNLELNPNPVPVTFKRSVTTQANKKMQSNGVTITGMNINNLNISVSDSLNEARLTVNGGSELTSAVVTHGDVVRLVLNAPSSVGTSKTATLNMGTKQYVWEVGLADSNISKKVFVTSTLHAPNFGGLQGAENICNSLASQAGFKTGNWKPILAQSNISPVNQIPWNWGKLTLVTGETVADSWDQLWSGLLQRSINKNEKGETLYQTSADVYTGFNPDGTSYSLSAGKFCSNWTSSTSTLLRGLASAVDKTWSTNTQANCFINAWDVARLYCIENDPVGEDQVPDAFAFPYLLYQNAGARLESQSVTIKGVSGPTPVTIVSTQGNAAFKIDGGPEQTSGVISNNQTLTLVMNSPASLGQSHKMEIKVGNSAIVPWRVFAHDPNLGLKKRIFISSGQYWPADLGGLSGANATCNNLAHTNSQLVGTNWVALLSSDANFEPSWAVNQLNYSLFTELWSFNADGSYKSLFKSGANLWNGSAPESLLTTNELGQPVTSPLSVVTNTSKYGFGVYIAKDSCQGFTNDTGYIGRYGIGVVGTSDWLTSPTVDVSSQCRYHGGGTSYIRLYCVEQ